MIWTVFELQPLKLIKHKRTPIRKGLYKFLVYLCHLLDIAERRQKLEITSTLFAGRIPAEISLYILPDQLKTDT